MTRNVLEEIKSDLESWEGKKVSLRANRGRKRVLQKDGILEKTYPHIFVVVLEDEGYTRRVSYTYSDVLTETVEIMVQGKETKIGCVNA